MEVLLHFYMIYNIKTKKAALQLLTIPSISAPCSPVTKPSVSGSALSTFSESVTDFGMMLHTRNSLSPQPVIRYLSSFARVNPQTWNTVQVHLNSLIL